MIRYMNLFKNVSNWWLHFAVKLGLDKSDPLIFKASNNIVFEAPLRVRHEFKEIFMEEAYSIGLQSRLTSDPIIIDIGANVGFFTMFIASRFPKAKILSYEPIENNYDQLKRNAELNEHVNISCFREAVYGYSGEISIYDDPDDYFTTAATVLRNPDSQNEPIRVPCTSLADIFINNDLSHCELLKLDCEGAEYEVLYNCPKEYLERIEQIAIEVHQGEKPDQNIVALADYLVRQDFKIHQIPGKDHMLWAWRQ